MEVEGQVPGEEPTADRPGGILLGDALRRSAARWPDKPFVVDGGRRTTFAAVDDQVDRLVSSLMARGVGHGDSVAVWLPNCTEWAVVALACFRLGAVLVPLNTRYKQGEAEQVLRGSQAKVLVLTDERWSVDYYAMACGMAPGLPDGPAGQLATDSLPHLRLVIAAATSTPLPGTIPLDDLLAEPVDHDAVHRAESAVQQDDTAIVVYTSGTTGYPKGAMHSHVLVANCRNIAREMHMEPSDRVLGHMPLYHIAGFCTAFVTSLLLGSTYYAVPHWKPDEVVALIAREGISILGGIPTHFVDLVEAVQRQPRDTASLKSAWIGGATVTPELARRARDVLQLDALQAVYGMTETTSTTTLSRFEDPMEIVCDNKGRIVGDFEVAVVDASSGMPRPTGEPGEVWVRGHIVMQGYYHDPDATAEAITDDGWFRTGDLGVFDDAGYLKIVGRLKDMFIVGGTNTYPAEIERFLQSRSDVRQAIVVGVPDARLGEVGYAFVQPADGAELTTAELLQACRASLADYKVPRYVEITDEFPLTSTGKIQRHALAAHAADRAGPMTTDTVG